MAFTIDLKEKVVLVTGVSSGIGLGVALPNLLVRVLIVAGCSRNGGK